MRLIAVSLAVIALSSCGDSARTVDRCEATRYGDWSNDCRSVYATADVSRLTGEEPLTHVLEFDGARFHAAIMITRSRYERFYTDRPPTQLVIDGSEYVSDPNFGNDDRGTMQIGNERFGLTRSGEPQLSADSGDTDLIRRALEMTGATYATVAYTESTFVRIPVSGFEDAIAAWD